MAISEAFDRLAGLFDPQVWSEWFASLDRGFAFLLLLPFIVAVVGVWASYARGEFEDERGADQDRDWR